jgi:hypothetical protein
VWTEWRLKPLAACWFSLFDLRIKSIQRFENKRVLAYSICSRTITFILRRFTAAAVAANVSLTPSYPGDLVFGNWTDSPLFCLNRCLFSGAVFCSHFCQNDDFISDNRRASYVTFFRAMSPCSFHMYRLVYTAPKLGDHYLRHRHHYRR